MIGSPHLKSQSLSREVQEIIDSIPTRNPAITVYDYFRVFDDSTCYFLSPEPKYIDYLFERRTPVVVHMPADVVQKNSFNYLVPKNGPYSEDIKGLKERFEVENPLDMVKRYNGYIDMICFVSRSDHDTAANAFVNDLEYLENFTSIFLDKTLGFRKRLEKHRFKLDSDMRPNFGGLNHTSSSVNGRLISQFDSLVADLVENLRHYQNIKLSKREIELVKYLMLGFSAKETADDLELSVRTVESYLDNLRMKLRCFKKSEIISKLIRIK